MLHRINRRVVAATAAAILSVALSGVPAAPAAAAPGGNGVIPGAAVQVLSRGMVPRTHQQACWHPRDASRQPEVWTYYGVKAWIIFPQSTFWPGDMCSMPNNRLIMQTDGNFVVYDQNNNAKWAADTYGVGDHAMLGPDGNLAVYSWHNDIVGKQSSTSDPDDVLAVQSDGNVVLYHIDIENNMMPIWETKTVHK